MAAMRWSSRRSRSADGTSLSRHHWPVGAVLAPRQAAGRPGAAVIWAVACAAVGISIWRDGHAALTSIRIPLAMVCKIEGPLRAGRDTDIIANICNWHLRAVVAAVRDGGHTQRRARRASTAPVRCAPCLRPERPPRLQATLHARCSTFMKYHTQQACCFHSTNNEFRCHATKCVLTKIYNGFYLSQWTNPMSQSPP